MTGYFTAGSSAKLETRKMPPVGWKYILNKENNMAYSKPQVLAQNGTQGVFAAGCPANMRGGDTHCRNCERTV